MVCKACHAVKPDVARAAACSMSRFVGFADKFALAGDRDTSEGAGSDAQHLVADGEVRDLRANLFHGAARSRPGVFLRA